VWLYSHGDYYTEFITMLLRRVYPAYDVVFSKDPSVHCQHGDVLSLAVVSNTARVKPKPRDSFQQHRLDDSMDKLIAGGAGDTFSESHNTSAGHDSQGDWEEAAEKQPPLFFPHVFLSGGGSAVVHSGLGQHLTLAVL
jgi:hypothetical protein